MSYGIGLVIVKEDLDKPTIRYDYCDWMLPIQVDIEPESSKKQFKEKWYPMFETEEKTSTLEKLKTAPCDVVCIIDKEGTFETLKDRNPVNGNIISLSNHLN